MSIKKYVRSLPKSETEVKVNGEWLNEVIPGYRTHDVSGRHTNIITVNNKKIGRRDGAIFSNKATDVKTLTVTFGLSDDSRPELEKSASSLFEKLDKPESEFIIFDETNRYYIGTVSSIEMSEQNNAGMTGYLYTGSFTIMLNNPYKYSTMETASRNSSGSSKITIDNKGGTKTPLFIEAKIKNDASYLGFILNNKSGKSTYYQIGNEETQANGSKENKDAITLFDDDANKMLSSWSKNVGYTINDSYYWNWNSDPVKTGSFRLQNDGRGTYIYANDFGADPSTQDQSRWHGPTLTKTIPANSSGQFPVDWQFAFRSDLYSNNDAGGEVGHQSVAICDADNNPIIVVMFEDNSSGAIFTLCSVKYSGKTERFWLPGLGQLRGDWGNFVTIDKRGYTITLTVVSEGQTFIKTYELIEKDKPARYITFSTFKFAWYSPLWYNVIYQAKMVMYNPNSVQNSKQNIIHKGDIVTIDSEKNELKINGAQDWTNVDIGSSPIMLEPGVNILSIVTSNWASIPEVTVKYRERWK